MVGKRARGWKGATGLERRSEKFLNLITLVVLNKHYEDGFMGSRVWGEGGEEGEGALEA